MLNCGIVCYSFHRIMVTLDTNNSTELPLDEDEDNESEEVRSLLSCMVVLLSNARHVGIVSGAFSCRTFVFVAQCI